jgi:hypothetical protein
VPAHPRNGIQGPVWCSDSPVNVAFPSCKRSSASVQRPSQTRWPSVEVVGDVHVVNPGSVGQPRDLRPGAAFAVIEYDGLAVELCGAEYDTGPVVIEATQAGADPDVIEVFSRSKFRRASKVFGREANEVSEAADARIGPPGEPSIGRSTSLLLVELARARFATSRCGPTSVGDRRWIGLPAHAFW